MGDPIPQRNPVLHPTRLARLGPHPGAQRAAPPPPVTDRAHPSHTDYIPTHRIPARSTPTPHRGSTPTQITPPVHSFGEHHRVRTSSPCAAARAGRAGRATGLPALLRALRVAEAPGSRVAATPTNRATLATYTPRSAKPTPQAPLRPEERPRTMRAAATPPHPHKQHLCRHLNKERTQTQKRAAPSLWGGPHR